jgi:hypothetical protein
LAGRVLLSLSIGFVTYKGVDVGINSIKQNVISSVGGLPAQAINLVAYLGFDKAMTIIFSAVTVSISMRLLGGSIKRMIAK